MSKYELIPVRTGPLLASIIGAVGLAGSASAGSTLLGDSGWQATWNDSLDGRVDVDFMEVVGNTVFLQKSAEFTQLRADGKFAAIVITFEQIGASSIQNFAIDDEIITNSTGLNWTGFNMNVNNNENVSFDPDRTADSNGGGPIGFSIDPFTTAVFKSNDRLLQISGGLVASGEEWFPGGGANDGQLWINASSGGAGNFQSFTLKETPTATVVPGPAVLASMVLGLRPFGTRRRRSA